MEDLDKIILAYIADKEAKHKADTQLTNTDSNNVVKLSNKHVYNIDDIKDPLVHHGKGCEKGDIEVNGNTGGHKCGICHKMGHYAPKCPSRENYR
ncbi:unnamed protein product [Rhizophagus irregularis]|nr:unnamed protein product [Rhizophagus irregularis]